MSRQDENFQMSVELLQPWSTFVMKTRLPLPIFNKMIAITDAIVDNAENEKSHGHNLAGQIKDELWIDPEILERENLMVFFQDVVRNFIIQQTSQQEPFEKERIHAEEWYTQLLSMWVVSQKDNEYNPCHFHSNCTISSVMYLKIPKYLPSRKPHRIEEDGAIIFTNNSGKDSVWGHPTMTLQPKVRDFFIFPASQQHFVYPFRTEDGKGERRSVSFNAVFSSKTEQDQIKKGQND